MGKLWLIGKSANFSLVQVIYLFIYLFIYVFKIKIKLTSQYLACQYVFGENTILVPTFWGQSIWSLHFSTS